MSADSSVRAALESIWFPALLLAVWQTASEFAWVNPFFFPPPTKVLATALSMTIDGELPRHLGATLGRWISGVTVGCLAGLLLGLAMGVSQASRRAFGPLVAALYSTPKLALFPLVMLLLGIGDASKVALIALVGLIFLATQTLDAIRGVNPAYLESARNHGAGAWAILRRVYIPATLPQIFTGLRIALTRSLVVAISIELVSGVDGLGAVIWLAWETLTTDRLYVGVLLSAGIGVLVHAGLERLERTLVPWRSS
jgi:NitT/TauT family transport system permease protein